MSRTGQPDEHVSHHQSSVDFRDTMKALDDIRATLRTELPELREKYNVDSIGICGSYVRGEQTATSDLDLLVTFATTPDILEFIALKQHLESRLQVDINLGTPEAIRGQDVSAKILGEVEYL